VRERLDAAPQSAAAVVADHDDIDLRHVSDRSSESPEVVSDEATTVAM
jgi:hypothetical protein